MNFIWLLIVLCVAGPIAGAVAHRIKQGGGSARAPGEDGPSRDEVRELRGQVSRLAERVDRLAEQQSFLEELLEERPALGSGDEERKTAP